ncbi:adenylate kinase [Methanothermobacter thermautotrophicus]|uniref:adenylate kinase n=1 Tax=Methanothermobacter thermautotrophicus TaxID=145262 RepID=UPI003D7FD8F7
MKGVPGTVAVVGVPGTGKTTVCRILSGMVKHAYINYGELMLRVAGEWNLAETLEDLFKLPMDQQHLIWLEAAHRIKRLDYVLMDLHGLDRSPMGYLISLPVDLITPDIIVILESDPQSIIRRRMTDSKMRVMESPESLREHMEMLRTSMFVCSAVLGSVVSIVENSDPHEAALDILRIIEAAGTAATTP